MKLHQLMPELARRGIQPVALSLEDESVESFRSIESHLSDVPDFPVLVDVGYRHTAYAHTTGYLIGQDGIVEQVFPMGTYSRGLVWALFAEFDRLAAAGR